MRYLLLFVALMFSAHARAEHPLDTGKITCGSFVFNNLFESDVNTGERKGFFVDVMNAVALRLALKVNFQEIGSFATGFEELKSGRYDMLCASLASFPANYGKMLFSEALFYDPLYVYGDATRDYGAVTKVDDLNDPKWRLAAMDGELGGMFGPIVFPKITMQMASQTAGFSALFMDLFSHKADLVMLTKAAAVAYEASNPGKLKQIIAVPVANYPIRFVFKPDDARLRDVFNMVIEDMRADGSLAALLKKYGF